MVGKKLGWGGRRIEGEGKQKGLIERGKQNCRSDKKKRIEGVKDGEKKIEGGKGNKKD